MSFGDQSLPNFIVGTVTLGNNTNNVTSDVVHRRDTLYRYNVGVFIGPVIIIMQWPINYIFLWDWSIDCGG